MPLPCAVRVVAVRHCPISALGARGGAFCMSIGGADVRLFGERTMRGWTRFRGAALAASRGRPRGSGQPFGIMQPPVLRTSCLFSLSVVRGASSPFAGQPKQPAACAAGCMVPKGLRRGRDLVGGFGLYQNLLNLVDLEEIAIPVYANL